MDMKDAFADVVCVYKEFEVCQRIHLTAKVQGVECHSGILKIALLKYDKLKNTILALAQVQLFFLS